MTNFLTVEDSPQLAAGSFKPPSPRDEIYSLYFYPFQLKAVLGKNKDVVKAQASDLEMRDAID